MPRKADDESAAAEEHNSARSTQIGRVMSITQKEFLLLRQRLVSIGIAEAMPISAEVLAVASNYLFAACFQEDNGERFVLGSQRGLSFW